MLCFPGIAAGNIIDLQTTAVAVMTITGEYETGNVTPPREAKSGRGKYPTNPEWFVELFPSIYIAACRVVLLINS